LDFKNIQCALYPFLLTRIHSPSIEHHKKRFKINLPLIILKIKKPSQFNKYTIFIISINTTILDNCSFTYHKKPTQFPILIPFSYNLLLCILHLILYLPLASGYITIESKDSSGLLHGHQPTRLNLRRAFSHFVFFFLSFVNRKKTMCP
jgi:hypothetical protein